MKRYMVVLAASRRDGGLCYAGKELLNVETRSGRLLHADVGGWLRPVPPKGGALQARDMGLRWWRGPARPLDVVEITLQAPMPLSYQPENWVLGRRKPHRVATWPASDLEALCDQPATLWANGHSTSHGHWDCIPEGPGSCDGASLFLIPLSDPHFVVQPEYRGKLKCRVGFRYRDSQYSLTVTDPACEAKLLPRGPGRYRFHTGGDLYACISLGAPFQGRHYKLAACILSSEKTA